MKRDGGYPYILVIVPVCIILGFLTGLLYSNNQNTHRYEALINGLQTELNQQSGEIMILTENKHELTEQLTDKLEEIRNLNNTLETTTIEKINLILELDNLKEKYKTYDDEMNKLKWDNVLIKSRLGDRLNWKTYTNYDFSFEHSEEMNLSIIDEGYDSGALINIKYFEPTNYLYFSWLSLNKFNPEQIVEDVEKEHDELAFEERNKINTKLNGHEAYIYIFSIEIGDGAFHGAMCTWYCQNTGRAFVLFQYSSGDPLTSFINILGTMKCHSLGDIA